MAQWLSIVVAPLVFLANLSLAYALVPLACQTQRTAPLHATSAVALAIVVAAALLAWRALRTSDASAGTARDDFADRQFLSCIGAWVSTLAALAIVLQWAAQAVLSPCIA
jgi:hypothetical protein